MDKSEAQKALDRLPADHVLTLEDIPAVASILRNTPFSYAEQAGGLLWLTIGDKQIETAGQLRDVMPASADDSSDDSTLGGAIGEAIANVLRGPLRELALLRIRYATLVEMLEEQGLIQGPELTRRFRRNLKRDFGVLIDQTVLDDETFNATHGDWLADLDHRLRERYGDEEVDALDREWKEQASEELDQPS